MNGTPMGRWRRRVGLGLTGLGVAGVAWAAVPGLPIWWAPRAGAEVKAAGRALFEHEWEPHDRLAGGDGLGPVFNERSCVACHFQGGVGGGGSNQQNVTSFEARPTHDRPEIQGGLVHKFAVENHFLDSGTALRELFPIVPDGVRVRGICQVLTRHDFDPVRTETVNSPPLFGAGWIDRLSSKSLRHASLKASLARAGEELTARFDGIGPGRLRQLPGGAIGKFGWKAQFATLEEFVAAACANEIGLGNPGMEQARPLGRCDYPSVDPDLDRTQFRALLAFVDTLDRPEEVAPPTAEGRDRAARGKRLFATVGCTACHLPEVGGLAGAYSDFRLHRLNEFLGLAHGGYVEDTPDLPLPPFEHPDPAEWKTPPLWGVADSAPYFHDGGSPTLEAAILRHLGDAKPVTDAYRALGPDGQAAILEFLATLKAPAGAAPAPTPAASLAAMGRATAVRPGRAEH